MPTKQALAQFRQAKRETALPKVGADRLKKLRSDMDEEGQYDRPLWAVVDGGYTNRTFIKHLPERTTAVGRIRADAKLYHLPESTEGKPGRNRVYGDRAPTPEELRKDTSVPWQRVEAFAAGKTHHFKIKTMTPLRWRPAGKEHDLRLIVIAPLGYRLTKNSKLLYRKPAYLICTDPNADIQEVLQAYVWRWDIEVNFRDEKSLLGVGQAQVRHEHSVGKVPALAVAAYAMLLTSAIQAYGPTGKPDSLPTPKWRHKQTASSLDSIAPAASPARGMGRRSAFLQLRGTPSPEHEAGETRHAHRKRPILLLSHESIRAKLQEPASRWFRPLIWLDAKLCRTPIILEDGPRDHGEVTYIDGVPVIIEKTETFQQSVGGDSGKAAADGGPTGAPQR